MTTFTAFDQRGQQVIYQYNYANMNLESVQNAPELLNELKQIQAELQRAIEQKAVTGKPANEAQYNLTNAVLEVEEQKPDKKTATDYLAKAKTAIEGIAALGGLVAAITKAAELVEKFL